MGCNGGNNGKRGASRQNADNNKRFRDSAPSSPSRQPSSSEGALRNQRYQAAVRKHASGTMKRIEWMCSRCCTTNWQSLTACRHCSGTKGWPLVPGGAAPEGRAQPVSA
eukprot:2641996-Amphidinium_carterae.1